ncbi:MAG: cyclic nucleotide-binding domain-containing protein [Proteobacteria bacterium]|nr:cyclic nucleotide-binding domain-containing protein [Pseudomonadota bacterium]
MSYARTCYKLVIMTHTWSSIFRKDKDEELIMNTLKKCFLFDSFNASELSIIRESVHIRKYNVGENVFEQHQAGTGMYIIVNGKILIEAERVFVDPKTGVANKRILKIVYLKDGYFFGELALVEDESVRNATAKVMEPTLLIGFFKPDFIQIINTRPSLGLKLSLKIAQALAERIEQFTEELHKLRFEN